MEHARCKGTRIILTRIDTSGRKTKRYRNTKNNNMGSLQRSLKPYRLLPQSL